MNQRSFDFGIVNKKKKINNRKVINENGVFLFRLRRADEKDFLKSNLEPN